VGIIADNLSKAGCAKPVWTACTCRRRAQSRKHFADAKKSLPINVDGAIGAILADLGMNPATFNGIFMIARTPGLISHVIEEQTRERSTRRIDPVNHGYDGPPPRTL
jgi:citrate synthase